MLKKQLKQKQKKRQNTKNNWYKNCRNRQNISRKRKRSNECIAKKLFEKMIEFHLTFIKILSIINIGNDKSTNVVLPNILWKLTSNSLKVTDVSIFYLCSCLSTQFLYRTVAKATFNVKDSINDIYTNSITLTINITTLPTKMSLSILVRFTLIEISPSR